LKYPYTHHTVENEAEELRCLNETKKIIQSRKAADNDVGAIIVEPITALGNR
jgi:4-aminobutyrate aminotransferase-like enzyme